MEALRDGVSSYSGDFEEDMLSFIMVSSRDKVQHGLTAAELLKTVGTFWHAKPFGRRALSNFETSAHRLQGLGAIFRHIEAYDVGLDKGTRRPHELINDPNVWMDGALASMHGFADEVKEFSEIARAVIHKQKIMSACQSSMPNEAPPRSDISYSGLHLVKT